MPEQFKSSLKKEKPKIIEVPVKPPVVELNGKKHDIRDLMDGK